jgi:hypothetical protein
MLIAALNKKIQHLALAVVLMFTGTLPAWAHGDHGGLDFEETSHLYLSMMQALEEASLATHETLSELELKYMEKGTSPTHQATVEFLGERITLDNPAYATLIDRAIDIFRQRVEAECSHCYNEKRIIESPSFRSKVFSFFRSYILHYTHAAKEAFVNPKSLVKASVGISAAGIRLFKIHGPIYLVYTAVTEAIESVFMGPAHWACTFFQWLYLPVAFVGHQVWDPMLSSGHGFSLTKRLGVSMRSVYLMAKYKVQMRRLFVETIQGNHRNVLRRGDYQNYIAGLNHHIESELDFDKFWGEIYRNFHLRNEMGKKSSPRSLIKDFDKIFFMQTPYMSRQVSEAERLYVAFKHADGINLNLSLVTKLADELYKQGKYSVSTYFKISSLLGNAGEHIRRYQTLLITGALSPRDNIAVQNHQSIMAELALRSIEKFFVDFKTLVLPTKELDQETIKWFTGEMAEELKAESKRLKKSIRTRKRFNEDDAERCRAYLSLVS